MTTESVVEKFAYSRPGYRLSDFSECGLPVFWLTVRALVLERKAIQPIQEACMRAIEAGLVVPSDLGQFLGLAAIVVDGVLGTLHSEEQINYSALPGENVSALSLTARGRQVLREAAATRPEERVLQFGFDGLLCRPILVDKATLAKPREARDYGWVEIPFLPPRRPELSELAIEDIDKIVRKAVGDKEEVRELLAITAIETRDLMFMPSVMLVFRSNSSTELQISFVVDGRPFDDRSHAFATKDGPKILGIKGRRPQKEADIAKILGVDDITASAQQTDAAQVAVVKAQEHVESIRQSLSQADNPAGRGTDETLIVAEDELEAARAALRQMTERWLYCADHPPLLWRALRETRSRLLIISPWIRDSVVDDKFCAALEELMKQGVAVYIGYGLMEGEARRGKNADAAKEPGKDPALGKMPITPAAQERLTRLSKAYPNFKLKFFGDTHAKILLSDSAFAIASSFNWLSFKGDPNKKFRDEQGYLVSNPTMIEKKFQEQMKYFGS